MSPCSSLLVVPPAAVFSLFPHVSSFFHVSLCFYLASLPSISWKCCICVNVLMYSPQVLFSSREIVSSCSGQGLSPSRRSSCSLFVFLLFPSGFFRPLARSFICTLTCFVPELLTITHSFPESDSAVGVSLYLIFYLLFALSPFCVFLPFFSRRETLNTSIVFHLIFPNQAALR